MTRYTKIINKKYVINDNSINANNGEYYGNAIDKLAEFENIIDDIQLKQNELSKQLEILRSNNQTKSYKFRELLGHKLINSELITIFESHNLI